MGEKIHGGSVGKEFVDSSFRSPDPNPDACPTTTHHSLILQDFLTPSCACGEPANPGHSSIQANLLSLDPFVKKRCSEDHNCAVDRRYKRMMKNRESASRSRARRMAYTCELEKKKIQLREENARLRWVLQQQELLSAAAAANEETPKKRHLWRSLSAPF